MDPRLKALETNYFRKRPIEFRIGDVVDVQVRIKEARDSEKDARDGREAKAKKAKDKKDDKGAGDKERIQTFTGTVIARKGSGLRETFTVRRIVAGEGVERVFPIHSPAVANVIVKRPGRARRAKLYYLRDRVGKATKTKERREDLVIPGEGSQPEPDAK